jgi:hypothetical protein
MERRGFLTAGLVIVLLTVLAATAVATVVITDAINRGSASCEIQRRSLRAEPHLVAVVQDIDELLTPIPGEKATPPVIETKIGNLREEAGAWVTIEREQPTGRRC